MQTIETVHLLAGLRRVLAILVFALIMLS